MSSGDLRVDRALDDLNQAIGNRNANDRASINAIEGEIDAILANLQECAAAVASGSIPDAQYQHLLDRLNAMIPLVNESPVDPAARRRVLTRLRDAVQRGDIRRNNGVAPFGRGSAPAPAPGSSSGSAPSASPDSTPGSSPSALAAPSAWSRLAAATGLRSAPSPGVIGAPYVGPRRPRDAPSAPSPSSAAPSGSSVPPRPLFDDDDDDDFEDAESDPSGTQDHLPSSGLPPGPVGPDGALPGTRSSPYLGAVVPARNGGKTRSKRKTQKKYRKKTRR